jgi:hypothetical protein
MNTWSIVVLMVGAAAIVGVLTIAVILLTGPNDDAVFVLQLPDTTGDAPCLAAAV